MSVEMELIKIGVVSWFKILSVLMFFAGTTALSAGLFTDFVANEYAYGEPSKFYKFFGFLFGIKSKDNALRTFMVGSRQEIKKNRDSAAPIRGFVWYFFGSIFAVLATLFPELYV